MVAQGTVPPFLLKAVWPRLSQAASSHTLPVQTCPRLGRVTHRRPRRKKQRSSLTPTAHRTPGSWGRPRRPRWLSPNSSCMPEPKGEAERKYTRLCPHEGHTLPQRSPAAQRGCCCPRRARLGADVKVPSCSACTPPMTSASLLSSSSTPPGLQ